MHTSNYLYHQGEQECHGFLAHNDNIDKPKPAVLIAHDWSGRSEFFCQKAIELAELGYVGFAIDMFGNGRLGESSDEKMALMQPLIHDRPLLLQRIQAGFDALVGMQEVDNTKMAGIGFCFGGLCVLDLARSGAELQGVVSFHGALESPNPNKLGSNTIHAKILALHGYEDPMVPPEQVNTFCREMTLAKADWQVHLYGHAMHGFTNPKAHDQAAGIMYNETASKRSYQSMRSFLKDVLG